MTDKQQPYAIQVRSELEHRLPEISAAVGPIGLDAGRFLRIAVLYMAQHPELGDKSVSRGSLILAVLEAARAGLLVDGKESAIIPYKGVAAWMPMVKGVVNLMLRSPNVQNVESRVVHEGDPFYYEYGLNPRLEHIPKSTTGPITHAYAIVHWDRGPSTFEVMSREELDIAQQASKAPNSPAYRNFPGEMDRRTVVKRISKYVDLSPEAQRAIALDNAAFGVRDGQVYFEDSDSQDYVSGLVKAQTQDRIEELKTELSENGEGLPKDLRYNPKVLEKMIEEGIAQNAHHAQSILDLLEADQKITIKAAIEQGRKYRTLRDQDVSAEDAAKQVREDKTNA